MDTREPVLQQQPAPEENDALELQEIEVRFNVGGEEENEGIFACLSVPPSLTVDPFDDVMIDHNGKKMVELACHSPEQMAHYLPVLDSAETKDIGGKTFWVVPEEYTILEKPDFVPYIIWRYYYFDGELYYSIDFFQNQNDVQFSTEEFESILETLEIKKK